MAKINILILTCSMNIGGGEKHLYSLISNMDKRKYKFVIVCLYELGPLGEKLLNSRENVKVYHDLMRNKFDLSGIMRLIQIMRSEDIDIIYMLHTPLTLFWGILCARIAGIRHSVVRSTTTNPVKHVKRRKVVNFFVLRYADRIIAQAYAHKQYQITNEGANPEKIVVIHNGVDISRFSIKVDLSELRETIGIPSEARVVGIVGRLETQKGHSLFLRAAKKIVDAAPDVYFLILGDGGERERLEIMSRALSINNNVIFMGMVNDVSGIIPLFDVAVLSSRAVGETFSNAVLEYMAASRPVVATNVGSIAEQVMDGETGFLVPYGDPDMLSDAILKLLNDPDIAKRMGTAGRKMVEEKFAERRMLSDYEVLFKDLLNQL